MNRDVKRYLRKATRGLWGRKRAEVKEELSAHIEARVTAYQIAGLNEEEAIQKTLQDLGHSKEVNSGMIRLYTLPKALSSSFFLIAVLTLSAVLLSSSVAQMVMGTFNWPTEDCVENADCAIQSNQLWLDTENLQAALEPQGVEVKQDRDSVTLMLPGGEKVFSQTTDQWFEDDKPVVREKGYISLWDILASVSEDAPKTAIRISGWSEPTVTLGDAKLKVTTDEEPIGGESFYLAYLRSLVGDILFEKAFYDGRFETAFDVDISGRYEHDEARPSSIHITDAVPGAYGLAVISDLRYSSERQITTMSFGVMQVGEDGTFGFNVPARVNTPEFMTRLPDTPEIGAALLVRLAGGVDGNWYEVVPPEQIRLE